MVDIAHRLKYIISPNYQKIINCCFLACSPFVLTIKSGYSFLPWCLVILSLPILVNRHTYRLTKRAIIFILTIILYFIITNLLILLDFNIEAHDFDIPSRALIAIFVFLLITQYPPPFYIIGYSFCITAIVTGITAIYEKMLLGVDRALNLASNVIQSGDISMSIALMCLPFALFYYQKKHYYHMLLFFISALFGSLGSILSGSRGGWLFTPLILIWFYSINRQLISKKAIAITLTTLVALFVITFSLPQIGLKQRINDAYSDLTLYQKKLTETSLGIRLELWQSAWDSFKEKPLLGWGKEGILLSTQKQIAQKKYSPIILEFNHAHNQYLDNLAKYGLIGFFALLMIFIIPLLLFHHQKQYDKEKTKEQYYIKLAGIILILSCADFCVSQSFFIHNSGVMYYFPTLAILMAYFLAKKPNHRAHLSG